MSFSGAFGRENENKYVSNLEFEVIKGRRTRIDTLFKLVTDLIYEFEVGVALPDLEPVRVIGAYNKLANGHTVRLINCTALLEKSFTSLVKPTNVWQMCLFQIVESR